MMWSDLIKNIFVGDGEIIFFSKSRKCKKQKNIPEKKTVEVFMLVSKLTTKIAYLLPVVENRLDKLVLNIFS